MSLLMDSSLDINHLRGILVKVQDCLSNDDRQRLHFFLGPHIPRRIRDDTSLTGTLSLIESLFEQDKINEQDCTFLINTFQAIQCQDAVRLLKDYQIRTQTMNPLISNEEPQEDKYARENYSTIVDIHKHQSKEKNVIAISKNMSNLKQDERLFKMGKFILSIVTSVLVIGFIISTSINAKQLVKLKEELKTKDAIIVNEQIANKNYSEVNSKLFRENTEFKQAMSLSNMAFVLKIARSLVNGTTVVGGNGRGDALNQLFFPFYMTIDDDQTIYVSDQHNHRVVAWKKNATQGEIVAGGNSAGVNANQLKYPGAIMIDRKTDTLIIADFRNERVVRWLRQNATQGETIISNIDCWSLAMDSSGHIYIADATKHEVRRWTIGEKKGTLVAGGNGVGFELDQLDQPRYIYIDQNDTLYISDSGNHRVLMLTKDAKQPVVIAGGRGLGCGLAKLNYPMGIYVDNSSILYVADNMNDRVIRWLPGATQGEVFVGGNGQGNQPNQLNGPVDITFDRYGNFYVLDHQNSRVQMFSAHELN